MTTLRRAISPVIATVIIVAIAIAIAVAVVGWLTGLWSSIAGGTPMISVPAVKLIVINDTNGPVKLNVSVYVKNEGSAKDRIVKIDAQYNNSVVDCNVPPGKDVVEANSAGWIENITCSISSKDAWKNIKVGDKVIVRIYFEKSGVMPIPTTVLAVETS